jgi:hypothetical protein
MLVFGERERTIEPRPALQGILAQMRRLPYAAEGLERHVALAQGLIDLGMLVQGLADAEFRRGDQDDLTPLQAAATRALLALARPLAASWGAGFRGPLLIEDGPLAALAAAPLPGAVQTKVPEGYAFYGVYPEAYAEAARALSGPATVIGLRSIGASLAAAAAAGMGAAAPITLRPTGHPFQRQLRVSARLEAHLLARRAGLFVIVDEGPGLSGSSFGAVADWLEARGVEPRKIVFMPSHRGQPGAMASEGHRRRWTVSRRAVREFDDLGISAKRPEHALEAWVEDLAGPATGPLQDISGGQWRALRFGPDKRLWPAASPTQERRKFLVQTGGDAWLVKFAGLGRTGADKFGRAQRLGRAGLTPLPVGLRHGFMVEPWLRAAPIDPRDDRPAFLPALAAYLGYRAAAFPAQAQDGASQPLLQSMIEANARDALGASAANALARRFPRAPLPLRPIRTDGRLHAWEWLKTTDGRWLKTDAVDHDDAHDLIGCQDLAWDVAGAEVELALTASELGELLQRLDNQGHAVNRDVLRFMRMAYPAFQLGLWTHAAACADSQERARTEGLLEAYRRRLDAIADDGPTAADDRAMERGMVGG